MMLAVRSSKSEAIPLQPSSLLGEKGVDIAKAMTSYLGITLLTINEAAVCTENSVRNIEALQINRSTASALLNPTVAEGMPFFNSLNNMAPIEQYEHLIHLLYINKSKRHKT